jgi:hypothetical protein
MHWIAPSERDTDNAALEKRLWDGVTLRHPTTGNRHHASAPPRFPWLVLSLLAVTMTAVLAHATDPIPNDPCAQPSPEEMARAAGVILPKLPWHVVNIWWDFEKPTEHFESLAVDVTIDRDVPATYNLYISPCGLGKMNGQQFYGGL